MPGPVRTTLWGVYALYLGWIVYLVWSPTPGAPGATIRRIVEVVSRLGVRLDAEPVEFALNILMLVPLSFIGGLLVRRLRVTDWTTIGFAASVVIEVVQRLALPTRFGSSRDVVANTLGSTLGAVLLALVLKILVTRRPSEHEADASAAPGTMRP